MKISPRFSVILCTYNRRNLALSALASLRRQTLPYHQFEVIVVDNGSSDGTLDAVRAYVSAGMQEGKNPQDIWHVRCLSEPQNGLAQARTTGLQAAYGDVAVFLHDDALADPYYLERLLIAYEETGADAIGGRVELSWEAARPHWLSEELLEVLGYFAPTKERTRLEAPTSFSSSNFSVKIQALRAIGGFSPLFSKRLNMPLSLETYDLCHRLREAGYILWYEPAAIVTHRASAIRLTRPFFVGRAYWQGRSEILLQYATSDPTQAVLPELREIAYLLLLHRPLLRLARRSTNERLLAAMEQARRWGRLQQCLQFQKQESTAIAVLFVRPAQADPTAELLTQSLTSIDCSIAIEHISLSWLWQHRARGERAIVHFYCAGAFNLTYWQRRRLGFRLWLAQRWGIRIVTSDTGGWWQGTHSLRSRPRRSLEHKLLEVSDIVLAHTRQPEQLYPQKQLRRRVRSFPHPGLYGYYAPPLPRIQACKQLGLPKEASTVYLCFAHAHTEQEIVLLTEAFLELKPGKQQKKTAPQLLLVGVPADTQTPTRLLKLAALHPTIHLSTTTPGKEDIPLYMGAIDTVVLPHFAVQTAGMLEVAILALSYERVVVAPNLPRFRGMLPPRASILYDPTDQASLVRALSKAQARKYHLNEKEVIALEAESSWREYAQRLLKVYQQLGRK